MQTCINFLFCDPEAKKIRCVVYVAYMYGQTEKLTILGRNLRRQNCADAELEEGSCGGGWVHCWMTDCRCRGRRRGPSGGVWLQRGRRRGRWWWTRVLVTGAVSMGNNARTWNTRRGDGEPGGGSRGRGPAAWTSRGGGGRVAQQTRVQAAGQQGGLVRARHDQPRRELVLPLSEQVLHEERRRGGGRGSCGGLRGVHRLRVRQPRRHRRRPEQSLVQRRRRQHVREHRLSFSQVS